MSTPQLAITHIAESQNQKEVTANDAFDQLDDSVNAQTSIVNADADLPITLAQLAGAGVLKFTGTLTADRYINIPAGMRAFIVRNAATGGNLIVQVTGGGGASVAVAPGALVAMYCDGVDVLSIGGSGGGGTGTSSGTIGGNFAYDITPTGTVNGSNPTFTLPNAPNPPASLQLFKNGRKMMNPIDFTISGATITYQSGSIPATGDVHVAGSYLF
jgi:hypothetical protein